MCQIFYFFHSEQIGNSIHSQQIISVELTDESCPNFLSVNLYYQSRELIFQNLQTIICKRFQGIGLLLCFGVLKHHASIFVIDIGQSESRFWQKVEKLLFGIAVVGKCLMIIQMVVCKVGKNSACELQPFDATLFHAVRTDFHKAVFHALIYHLFQIFVDSKNIGCRVFGVEFLVIYINSNGGNKPHLVPRFSE